LICLATAGRDAKPIARFLYVLAIKRNQLGASKGASKTDERQSAVSNVGEPAADRGHGYDVAVDWGAS
jgi:hypothetical protein